MRRPGSGPALGSIWPCALVACAGTPSAQRSPEPPAATDLAPPVAALRPFEVPSPNGTRVDPYHWLRDDTRSDPAVLGHLAAENAYAKSVLAPVAELKSRLYAEMVGRIKQDDASVPVFDRGYWYYRRFEIGKEYPIYARRKGSKTAPEQVLLDVSRLAVGHDYYDVGGSWVSPDGTRLAYVEDTVGRFEFVLRVIEIATGKTLLERDGPLAPSVAWSGDSGTVFFVEKDPTTLRAFRVKRAKVGTTGQTESHLVYQEQDETFSVELFTTKSRAYVGIFLSATLSDETRLIDAAHPERPPAVFYPREPDHEYSVDHLAGRFVVRSNWSAPNFRLMQVAEGKQGDRRTWKDLLPPRDDVFVHDFALFDRFVAVGERAEGLRKIRVLPVGARPDARPEYLDSDQAAYAMYLEDLPDPASPVLRYRYTSPTTPTTTYEIDVRTRKREQLKQEVVLGGFDPAIYATELLFVPARDGQKIPVSIVYRKNTARDGTAPLLQYGYGSYGNSMDPRFRGYLLSLLDRGFVHAVAHVRGGQEMGRAWYEEGRLLHKRNTFTDFIDVTQHLVAHGYGAPDKIFAQGGSAGGLLVGAVANMRPDLYRGILADVPFVDVVTTMLDESLPLTTEEYDEWGDPRQNAYYRYMLSYSPYDNVKAQAYPSILVNTALWDSQVQYFEPAKWVAKLRATKTDGNLLVLNTEMEAGHGGKSGRFQQLDEVARDFAFILHVLARPDARPGWPPAARLADGPPRR